MSENPHSAPVILRILGVSSIIGVWEILARLLNAPVFVPPTKVLLSFWNTQYISELLLGIFISFLHIILGFGLAVLFGISLGIAISQFHGLRLIVQPAIDVMRPVAALTLYPLIILVLGLGIKSKAFIIVMALRKELEYYFQYKNTMLPPRLTFKSDGCTFRGQPSCPYYHYCWETDHA